MTAIGEQSMHSVNFLESYGSAPQLSWGHRRSQRG